MQFNFREFFTVTMILFAVIDVIGSIPVIIDLRSKVGEVQSGKASLASLLIMLVFFFIGDSILELIGLDISSFAIAGSLVIFFIAIEMILGVRLYKDSVPETASIVPIAFPLVAGAGTMTTLLSLRAEFYSINIIIAILLNIILVYLVLKSSAKIEKALSENGLMIIRKVFGVVLLAIAVKLFATNVKGLFA